MAIHSVPDLYYAGMTIPVFELHKILSASLTLIRGPCVMWALCMFQIGPSIWPCWRSKTVKLELKKKETGTKTVTIATSNYVPSDVFLWLNIHVHAKYPFHCPILSRDILDFLFWLSQSHLVMSSLPNLHNRENLNISGREEDIKKRKTPSLFVLKGLLNKLIF